MRPVLSTARRCSCTCRMSRGGRMSRGDRCACDRERARLSAKDMHIERECSVAYRGLRVVFPCTMHGRLLHPALRFSVLAT